MPIYEYECAKCGHRFEKIQKFTDPQVRTCPECNGKARRLASAPAIQFKGTGWYITDYGRKGSVSPEDKPDKGKEEKPAKETPAKPAKPAKPSRKDSGD